MTPLTSSLPSAPILPAQVEAVSAAPAAPVVPAPAASPSGGAQSSKVAELELRREGGRVYAKLRCIACDGIGSVEVGAPSVHSASIDPPCGLEVPCPEDGCVDGLRVLESTSPEFTAAWAEHLYTFCEADSREANRLLCALEDEATEWAFQQTRLPQDYTGALDRLFARLPAMKEAARGGL